MTAMMCFFLVMWLINAANEQTKAAVASYFNPVKLIDRNSSRKGLEDIGDGPNAIGDETEKPQTPDATPRADGQRQGRRRAGPQLAGQPRQSRNTPTSICSPIPTPCWPRSPPTPATMQNISRKGDGGAQTSGPATGASGGESYRDPFAPDFWTKQVEAPAETEAEPQTAIAESQMTAILERGRRRGSKWPTQSRAAEGRSASRAVEAGRTGAAAEASRQARDAPRPETKPLGELLPRKPPSPKRSRKPTSRRSPSRRT